MDKTINPNPAPYRTEKDHDFMKSIWHEFNRIRELRKEEDELLERAISKIEHHIMDEEQNDKLK